MYKRQNSGGVSIGLSEILFKESSNVRSFESGDVSGDVSGDESVDDPIDDSGDDSEDVSEDVSTAEIKGVSGDFSIELSSFSNFKILSAFFLIGLIYDLKFNFILSNLSIYIKNNLFF